MCGNGNGDSICGHENQKGKETVTDDYGNFTAKKKNESNNWLFI